MRAQTQLTRYQAGAVVSPPVARSGGSVSRGSSAFGVTGRRAWREREEGSAVQHVLLKLFEVQIDYRSDVER